MEPDQGEVMSFENRSTNDLIDILWNGGSFSINAGARSHNDWLQLAHNAKQGGSQLTITGVSTWSKQTIVEVAHAGKGHVSFVE